MVWDPVNNTTSCKRPNLNLLLTTQWPTRWTIEKLSWPMTWQLLQGDKRHKLSRWRNNTPLHWMLKSAQSFAWRSMFVTDRSIAQLASLLWPSMWARIPGASIGLWAWCNWVWDKEYWVSHEKNSILEKNQTLSPGLHKIKQEVIGGTFDEKNHAHISIPQAHKLYLNHSETGPGKCKLCLSFDSIWLWDQDHPVSR